MKFERIVGSTYYSVKPEMRAPEVTNTATPFRAEASVPAPPGKDTNATSYAVSGGYPPAPAASQTSHNSALHQLLYSRPPQVPLGLLWCWAALAANRFAGIPTSHACLTAGICRGTWEPGEPAKRLCSNLWRSFPSKPRCWLPAASQLRLPALCRWPRLCT